MSVSLWHSHHPFQRLEDDAFGSGGGSSSSSSRGESSRQKGKPMAPRLDLSLDQAICRATDKHVTGSLYIDTTGVPSAVSVVHLRVQVVGTARIHGDDPKQPLSYGLFGHKKDIKLLSKGIRILNKEGWASSSGVTISDTSSSSSSSLMNGTDSHAAAASTSGNYNDRQPQVEGKTTRSQQSRAIDSFVVDLAFDKYPLKHSSGSLLEQQHSAHLVEDKVYDLAIDSLQRVRFSVPIRRKRALPGTMDDPHYPIQYTVAAVLIYTNTKSDGTRRYLSHTMAPIHFEPSSPEKESMSLMTATAAPYDCCYMSESRIERILFAMLHKQQFRQRQQRRWLLVERLLSALEKSMVVGSAPYVACALALDTEPVFARGKSIPLQVHLESRGLALQQIAIRIKIKSVILLTCSVGEQGECKLVDDTTFVFPLESNHAKNDHTVPSQTANKAVFDLSDVLRIGEDWAYTVLPEMTRDVFELQYDLETKVYVQASKIDGPCPSPPVAPPSVKHFRATDCSQTPTLLDKSLYSYILRPASLPVVLTGDTTRL